MQINTKYDIGQPIYKIYQDINRYKQCESCGHDIPLERVWKVGGQYSIDSIECVKERTPEGRENKVKYNIIGSGIIYDELIDNGDRYFTTREYAQVECDKRNAKLKGK